MTARIGYLVALASGRRDGPLLQPPRPLFPPVGVADAELAFAQEALAVPEPGRLPSGAAPGRSARATAAPNPAPPASRGPALTMPALPALADAPARRLSNTDGVTKVGAGRPTPSGRGGSGSTAAPGPAPSAWAYPAPAEQAPAEQAPAEQAPAGLATPPIGINRALATDPSVPPTHNPADGAAELPGHPRVALTGVADGTRPGASPGHGVSVALGDGTAGHTARPGLTERAPADPATPRSSIREGPATGPGVPPPHNRADGTADLPGDPGLAVFRTAGGARPGPASVGSAAAPPSPAAGISGASGLVAGPPRRQAAVQAAAAEPAGRYLQHESAPVRHDHATAGAEDRAVTAASQLAVPQPADDGAVLPPHWRAAPGAVRTPLATLSIGTIEITVLPPPVPSPAHPAAAHPVPAHPAPASSPDRLSRGLGPWYGRDQA